MRFILWRSHTRSDPPTQPFIAVFFAVSFRAFVILFHSRNDIVIINLFL